jgi:hypothetical protein
MAKKPKEEGKEEGVAVESVSQEKETRQETSLAPASTALQADDLSFDPASWREIDKAMDENIAATELQFSRLAIAQPLVPEVVEEAEGWQKGGFYDSVTREPLFMRELPPWLLAKGIPKSELKPQTFLPFVPIFKLPTEYVKWPTKEERKAGVKMFHWKSLDPNEQRVREGVWPPVGVWQGQGAPPVTQHCNIFGFPVDLEGSKLSNSMIASLSRTSFKTGRKWVTQIKHHRMNNLAPWGRIYYLYTELKTFDEGQAFVLQFAKGPKLLELSNGQELHRECFTIAKQLADGESGRAYQEAILAAAQFALDEAHTPEGEGGDEGKDPDF